MNKGTIYICVALLTVLTIRTILRNDDWASNKALWQSVLRENPGSLGAHIELGGEYHKAGNPVAAMEHYRKTMTLAADRVRDNPSDTRSRDILSSAQVNAAYLLSQQGDFVSAEQGYRATLSVIPRFPPAVFRLAQLMNLKGRFSEAITIIDDLIVADAYGPGFQERGKLYYLKGEAQCANGFAVQANENFRHARTIEAGLPAVECR